MALACGCVLTLIAAANWAKYGRFETVDLKGAAFTGAVSSLQRVRVGDAVAHVPVPEQVRRAVYPLSPAFARLQPYLEDERTFWRRPGCQTYPDTCGDYAGGWFIWALRDGVAGLGEYGSPAAAATFYRAVSAEVDAACAAGRLDCARGRIDLMPRVGRDQWETLPARLADAARLLLWQGVREPQLRSHLGVESAKPMWEFVGRPRVPDDAALGERLLAGWFRAPDDTWLAMRCGDGAATVPERLPSPDVAAHFQDPDAGDRRFRQRLAPGQHCVLEITVDAQPVQTMDQAAFVAGHVPLDVGDLYFDGLGEGIPSSRQAPAWALAAKRRIGDAHAWLMPWLAGAGLLAFAWLLLRAVLRRRLRTLAAPLPALAAAAWCLVASRALLLALVDVSSFPAINVQYMQAAFPVLVLASFASMAAVAPVLRRDAPPGGMAR